MSNIRCIQKEIRAVALRAQRAYEEIQLIVVSKNRTVEEIQEVYKEGCRDFGESRIPEALQKMECTPSDIRWHFIGKLQKNKVGKAIGKFALIHSVDCYELAEYISTLSEKRGVKTAILLQTNTSGELSKGGLSPEKWEELFPKVLELTGIEVAGLMTMAPYTEDERVIRNTFCLLKRLQEKLQKVYGVPLATLSMGMSHDYPLAIEEGATLIRLGEAIFS